MRSSFTDSVRGYREATTFLVCQVLVGLLAAWAVLYAVPAHAQPSLLAEVTIERARYGAVTSSDVAAILNAVAWRHRSEGWGLLEKTFGANCPTATTRIACDILVHRPSGQHFDVLRDAEGSASPVWQNKGPIDLSRFLAPVDPGQPSGGPVTPPEPQAPSVDLGPLLTRLDALERAVQALSSSLPPLGHQVDARGRAARRADGSREPTRGAAHPGQLLGLAELRRGACADLLPSELRTHV